MENTISADKVRDLFDVMEKHGVTIQYKNDGYKVWWHLLAALFAETMFAAIRKFQKAKNYVYFENFTTVFGKHIYLAEPLRNVGVEDIRLYTTIRHELIHVFQKEKYGLWFMFSYLFVLPAIWTMRGSKWEMEAYTQNMIVYHEVGRPIEGYIESLGDLFTSPAYLFMYSTYNKYRCLKGLNDNYEKIKAGEIGGMWPYHPEYPEGVNGIESE